MRHNHYGTTIPGGGHDRHRCVFLIATLFMVPRRLVIRPINRIQGQMVKFSKSGNLDRLVRTGEEIEALSTAFRDMAKDIDEKHYSPPECTSSEKHILGTLLDN